MPLIHKSELPLPGWLTGFLFRFTGVDKVNGIYDETAGHKGPDFADALLKRIGIEYQVGNAEVLDTIADGPFVTISNHPYGSIDGIMLVDFFGHLDPGYKVMVNKFLSRVEAMDVNMITVVPTGDTRGPARAESIEGVKRCISNVRNGSPVGFFPSGAVSDLKPFEGFAIRDREWQESVIRLIKKLRVPVLPVRFFDRNSDFYYALGLISWKIRLLRLPKELINKAGKRTRMGLGRPISVEEQDRFEDIGEYSEMLRSSVYGMPLPNSFVSRSELSEKLGHFSDARHK